MEKMSGSFFFSFCSSFLVIFRSDAPPWGQEQRPSARRHWSDRRRDYFFFFEMIGMKLLRLQRPPFSPLFCSRSLRLLTPTALCLVSSFSSSLSLRLACRTETAEDEGAGRRGSFPLGCLLVFPSDTFPRSLFLISSLHCRVLLLQRVSRNPRTTGHGATKLPWRSPCGFRLPVQGRPRKRRGKHGLRTHARRGKRNRQKNAHGHRFPPICRRDRWPQTRFTYGTTVHRSPLKRRVPRVKPICATRVPESESIPCAVN